MKRHKIFWTMVGLLIVGAFLSTPEGLRDAVKSVEELKDVQKVVKDLRQESKSGAEAAEIQAARRLGRMLRQRFDSVRKAYGEDGQDMGPRAFAAFEQNFGPRLERRVPSEEATHNFGGVYGGQIDFPSSGATEFRNAAGDSLSCLWSITSDYPFFYAPTLINLRTGEVYQGAFWKVGRNLDEKDFPLFGPWLPPQEARVTAVAPERTGAVWKAVQSSFLWAEPGKKSAQR